MSTYKFKTNINCQNCLAKVRPFLEAEKKIDNWEVDLTDEDRTLTVEAKTMSPEEISETVKKSGFTAKPVEN